MYDDNLANLVRRRVSLASMIDNGASRDCIPCHKRARQQAKQFANRSLREAVDMLAQVRPIDRDDHRREAEKVHQNIRDGFGYNLVIYFEKDGTTHFGDVNDEPIYESPASREVSGRGSSFSRASGLSLTDVFKQR